MSSWTAATLEDLQSIAKELLTELSLNSKAHVLGLSGELGAGKTAFVKALAREFGIKEDITSPTFVIMKSYDISGHNTISKLVHIDAYRIESDDEMRVLKFTDILKEERSLICIEWPERISALIPKDALKIHMEITEGETRSITYGS